MGNETGVLLMAYGAAGSLDEVEPYLNDIRGGRPVSPSLVEDIKRRYSLMGGKSPLLDTTRQLASALETSLNRDLPPVTVYVGMRHWHPFIKDTVSQMAADGIQKIIAICLTPYHSKLSVGAYIDKLNEGIAASGKSFSVQTIESWNDHPALIEALAEKVGEALERFPAEIRPKVPLVFTAHSLPERILAEQDPYPQELRETIELIMKKIGPYSWRLAYQSPGRTPEPWLGPDAGAVIDELAMLGHQHLVMAPIGFISDHMETLYDVDVMYKEQCRAKGIKMERVESLNTSPGLVKTLAAMVREQTSKIPAS